MCVQAVLCAVILTGLCSTLFLPSRTPDEGKNGALTRVFACLEKVKRDASI